MERDLLQIGVLIAVLRKNMNVILSKEQIFEGIRIAKQIGVDEAIAKEAGGEPANETAVIELATLTTGASYADVVSYTVPKTKTTILSKIEMACSASADYANVTWQITIGVIVKELILPTALTLTFPELNLRGGTVVKVEAKTASGTPSAWADITGKEVL